MACTWASIRGRASIRVYTVYANPLGTALLCITNAVSALSYSPLSSHAEAVTAWADLVALALDRPNVKVHNGHSPHFTLSVDGLCGCAVTQTANS